MWLTSCVRRSGLVEELDEVPAGGRAIFSAHGVAPSVRTEAKGAAWT